MIILHKYNPSHSENDRRECDEVDVNPELISTMKHDVYQIQSSLAETRDRRIAILQQRNAKSSRVSLIMNDRELAKIPCPPYYQRAIITMYNGEVIEVQENQVEARALMKEHFETKPQAFIPHLDMDRFENLDIS